jgi:hypothetical protein
MLTIEPRLTWNFNAMSGRSTVQAASEAARSRRRTGTASSASRAARSFGAGNEWFVPYYLDVGTGNSDFTWQISGGIGYAYPWGELVATWRYLHYNFKSDSKLEDLTVNGPLFGVAFRW